MPGRYQFSLPERRSRDGWFRIGTLDVTTTALMVLIGVASMFVYAADRSLLEELYFVDRLVRAGDVWRIATWPLPNPPTTLWVILTLAFFWFLGHAVEDTLGRKRYTVLIVLMTVIPAALVTFMRFQFGAGAFGVGILGIGMLVIFALDNPGAQFFFGIPAWVLALVYVGIDVLRYLGDRLFGPLMLELLVIAVGCLGARQWGMLSSIGFIPAVGGRRSRAARRARAGRPRRQTASSVVTGPWETAATPATSIDQIELDRLLDKISAEGLDSLSKTEKQRLNELSKRLRGR